MSRIQELDLTHRDGLHRIELIHRDEAARHIKLQLLTLRDDNAQLGNKCRQIDSNKERMAKQFKRARNELDVARRTARSKDAVVKKQSEELQRLRVRGALDNIARMLLTLL
jgi:hypothetical protein